ncbi:hypothetical protein Lal_00002070 [Lupinus albus]|nr:hypothetical protein Lal_00002070 [Lupinus albus]
MSSAGACGHSFLACSNPSKELQIRFYTTYDIPFRPSLALRLVVQRACPRGYYAHRALASPPELRYRLAQLLRLPRILNHHAKTKGSGYSRRPTSANKLETYAVTEVESEHFREMSNGRTDWRGRENCEENRDWRLERNVRAICTDRHRGRLLVRGERKEYNCYGVRNESTLGGGRIREKEMRKLRPKAPCSRDKAGREGTRPSSQHYRGDDPNFDLDGAVSPKTRFKSCVLSIHTPLKKKRRERLLDRKSLLGCLSHFGHLPILLPQDRTGFLNHELLRFQSRGQNSERCLNLSSSKDIHIQKRPDSE